MPGFTPEPLRVTCRTCGAEGYTYDFQHPGRAVDCGCCPLAHDHDAAANACPRTHEGDCGLGVPGCAVCRPVAIWGVAHLTALDPAALMEMLHAGDDERIPEPEPETVRDGGPVLLWQCLTRRRHPT